MTDSIKNNQSKSCPVQHSDNFWLGNIPNIPLNTVKIKKPAKNHLVRAH